MILDIVTKFVPKEEILLVLSNYRDKKSNSSDIDIYCITTEESSVHLFYNEENEWVEIFLDSISDVYKKIENIDEISINFIRELRLEFGDNDLYYKLIAKTDIIVGNYCLPSKRKNLLKYRVKVLLSKYINPEPEQSITQQHFILNAITYPLIQLILENYKIFPASPKLWIRQLQQSIPAEDFNLLNNFINQRCDRAEVINLCDKYTNGLDSIDINKKHGENETTFIK